MNARPLGAAVAGAAATLLLHAGGVPWLPALVSGLAALVFTSRRTIPGTLGAFAMALAVAAMLLRADHSQPLPGSMVIALAGLEVYGIVTVAAAARSSTPPHVSRRLLGAWLASSSAILLGVALCAGASDTAGSALVAGGLAWKLGVVPAFAWAPLLIRHQAPHIMRLGIAGAVSGFALLAFAMPRLPDPGAAGTAVLVLSLATAPWALRHVVRQWRTDPRCARSYGVVLAAAGGLVLLALTAHLTFPAHSR